MPKAETDIAAIAASLRDAKEQHKHVTLVLGSRTSVLYSNDCLYKALAQQISTASDGSSLLKHLAPSDKHALHLLEPQLQTLKTLSSPDRFKACYNILKKLSEGGIHTILTDALAPVHYREEDELLGGFIKSGFFDPIITTNIETLLEDSCSALWGMQQPYDYRVIRCGKDKSEAIEQGETRYARIVKVFGDLSCLQYKTASNEFNLEDDQIIKQYLRTKLSEAVLVIGYDPTWDRPMEQAIPELGEVLWYVNEELPPQNTYLMRVLNQRKSRYLTGTQGSIHTFLKALHDEIGGGVSRDAEINITPIALQAQNQVRKKAFISYSPKNKEQLEQLQTHLKGYLDVYSEDLLDYWEDTEIPSGANREEEIREALKSTKVAALLVSADFLASDFIREYELPALLKAAQAKEITLLSVLLGPCAFARTPLYQYQAVNNVAHPLMGSTQDEQDMIWAKLAELVNENLSS